MSRNAPKHFNVKQPTSINKSTHEDFRNQISGSSGGKSATSDGEQLHVSIAATINDEFSNYVSVVLDESSVEPGNFVPECANIDVSLTIRYALESITQPSILINTSVNKIDFSCFCIPTNLEFTYYYNSNDWKKQESKLTNKIILNHDIAECDATNLLVKGAYVGTYNYNNNQTVVACLFEGVDDSIQLVVYNGVISVVEAYDSVFINDTCDMNSAETWQVEYLSRTVFKHIYNFVTDNKLMEEIDYNKSVVIGYGTELNTLRDYMNNLINHCNKVTTKNKRRKIIIVEKNEMFQHYLINMKDNDEDTELGLLMMDSMTLEIGKSELFVHSSSSANLDKYNYAKTKRKEGGTLTSEYGGIFEYCLKNYIKCAYIVSKEDSEIFRLKYFIKIREQDIPRKFIK
eukprot:NODE_247_length_12991_cov_0.678328.p3 type:complete len:402 gc:universal NODE_247_length_12991_cov_0.678328:5879-4674(-)